MVQGFTSPIVCHQATHRLEVRHLKFHLQEFKKKERWKQLTDNDGNSFQTWEDYVQYPEPNGVGLPAASVEAILEAVDNALLGEVMGNHGGDRRSEKAKDQVDNQVETPRRYWPPTSCAVFAVTALGSPKRLLPVNYPPMLRPLKLASASKRRRLSAA
jgi:hypothetical protein